MSKGMVCRTNYHWDIYSRKYLSQPTIMEVKPEILEKFESLSEIIDRITVYEKQTDKSELLRKKNSLLAQNHLEFLTEISLQLESLILHGFLQFQGNKSTRSLDG